MWMIFRFYNIIITSANVGKGGWGLNAYSQNVDKKTCFFNPSLTYRHRVCLTILLNLVKICSLLKLKGKVRGHQIVSKY